MRWRNAAIPMPARRKLTPHSYSRFDRQFNNVFRVKVERVSGKEAPAECSTPWSTGRIERYPVQPDARCCTTSAYYVTPLAGVIVNHHAVYVVMSGEIKLVRGIVIQRCCKRLSASLPSNCAYLSLLCSRKFRLDIGYGLSCPPFAGNHNPGRYRRVLPSFDVFSAFSVGSIHQKKCYRGQFSPQRYLKGITKWYCHRVPSLPVMKELKDENNSKAVVHDFVEWFIWGAWFVPLWLWLSKAVLVPEKLAGRMPVPPLRRSVADSGWLHH